MTDSLMTQEAKAKAFNDLCKLINQITDLITQVSKVNPDEPIGESRQKMVQTMNFADDVIEFGQLVLNDDPHVLYQRLQEAFRD